MAGTINSLGIGAGVLTSDVIDKLKANDVALSVTPYDNKLTLQKQKSDALNLLSSLLTSFKSSVSSLGDSTLYQQRSVSGNTSGINVIASPGVNTQSFSISNVQLATKNVQQSGKFLSLDQKVSSGSGTMNINVGGLSYNIGYTNAMSLTDLKDAINTTAGAMVKASTLQIGQNDYRLVLTSVETGANQTISVSDSPGGFLNQALLQKDSLISGSYVNQANPIVATTGAGTYSITMNGTTYNVAYNAGDTMSQLVTKINASVGSNVASLQLVNGTDAQLVINSTATGNDPTFSVSDSGGLDAALTAITNITPGMGEIQAARDATFKYDGITITRSSNEITDIIPGVTIKLSEDNASANISISQNVSVISDNMKTLADSYNTLMSQLKDMTIADVDAGKVGIFNGDSSINSIRREVNKILTSMDNNGMALSQFGIDLNENGIMSFNSSTFTTNFTNDSTKSESFFSGKTVVDSNGNTSHRDGVFQTLDGLLKSYTSANGTLSSLLSNSTEESKTLQTNRTRTMSLIQARYNAMTARFVEYDAIMSRLNSQFSSLQQQIQMAVNAKG